MSKEKILYHASPVQGIKRFRKSEDRSGNNNGKVIFGTPEPSFAAAFGLKWDDGKARLETEVKDKKAPNTNNYKKTIIKVTDKVDLDAPCSMYRLKGEFKPLRKNGDIEEITNKDVKIVEEKQYDSFKDMAKEYGVDIRKVTEKHILDKLKGQKTSNFEKKAEEDIAGMEKIASYDAKRKKQYWQMLKRLYGGSDEAMEVLKKKRDFNIYHGTANKNFKNIKKEGLKAGNIRNIGNQHHGNGVYFGSKQTSELFLEPNFIGKEKMIRLKRPSEFNATDKTLYPNINKAFYDDKNVFRNIEDIKNMSKSERARKVFGGKKLGGDTQFHINEDTINPNILKKQVTVPFDKKILTKNVVLPIAGTGVTAGAAGMAIHSLSSDKDKIAFVNTYKEGIYKQASEIMLSE